MEEKGEEDSAFDGKLEETLKDYFANHGRMLGNWVLSVEQYDDQGRITNEIFGGEDLRTWQAAGLLRAATVWNDQQLADPHGHEDM